jgi:hypothetical protein
MGDSTKLNWVQKRNAAERNLADGKQAIWRDVCGALTDAVRSFNEMYQGSAIATPINGCRFKAEANGLRVDVAFDTSASKIEATCESITVDQQFDVQADHTGVFIATSGKRVLAKILFPSAPVDSRIEIW